MLRSCGGLQCIWPSAPSADVTEFGFIKVRVFRNRALMYSIEIPFFTSDFNDLLLCRQSNSMMPVPAFDPAVITAGIDMLFR